MNKWFCYKEGIEIKKRINALSKEIFRKSIHMCAAIIPFLLNIAYWPVIILLSLVLIFYCIAEFLRYKGKTIPVISAITAAAARKRDENHFVLGPATLALGILITALFFQPLYAAIGIFALAFGDGLASLVGKFFGRIHIPFSAGKTVAGSLTCFVAIFSSTFCLTQKAFLSFAIAFIGMIIEILPLKDFDNLFIPIIIAAVSQFYFHI